MLKIRGPYAEKKEKNVPIDYSFNCHDVMSDRLKRIHESIDMVEISMNVKFPRRNNKQEEK